MIEGALRDWDPKRWMAGRLAWEDRLSELRSEQRPDQRTASTPRPAGTMALSPARLRHSSTAA